MVVLSNTFKAGLTFWRSILLGNRLFHVIYYIFIMSLNAAFIITVLSLKSGKVNDFSTSLIQLCLIHFSRCTVLNRINMISSTYQGLPNLIGRWLPTGYSGCPIMTGGCPTRKGM